MVLGINFSRGLDDAWSSVATFVPKFVGFLVILVIGRYVAKAIAKIADKALERVGFDKAVERGGVKKALESSQYDASDVVGKVIYYALFLLVLQLAFGVFGPNPVSDMITGVVAYLPKVVVAMVIVVLAAAIAAVAKEAVQTALGELDYGRTLGTVTSIGIITVGAFMALSQLQIAPAIVNGLFYGLLVIVVGSSVIAIGGGGIQPMRSRWEQALQRYDQEKPKVRQQLGGADERLKERTEEMKGKVQGELSSSADDAPDKPSRRSRPLSAG